MRGKVKALRKSEIVDIFQARLDPQFLINKTERGGTE
jgi:hypothetical protein